MLSHVHNLNFVAGTVIAVTVVASLGSSTAVAAVAVAEAGAVAAATGGTVGGGVSSGGTVGAASTGACLIALVHGVQRFAATSLLPINQTIWSLRARESLNWATGDPGLKLLGASQSGLTNTKNSGTTRRLADEAPATRRIRLNALLNILVVLSVILAILALVQACAHYMYAAVPQPVMPPPECRKMPTSHALVACKGMTHVLSI